MYVSLDPDLTCAQCHEVTSACQLWKSSAHSDVRCVDCHGTALSGGIKGLAEKTGMIYSHFTKKQTNEDVSLNEEQVLAVADRCAVCHQAEQAAWESGAHSTTYKDIFMWSSITGWRSLTGIAFVVMVCIMTGRFMI